MQLLPVVQRELIAIARRPGTAWGRTLSAGIAFAVFASLVLASNSPLARLGPQLLQLVTLFIFLECLIAGPRYTADCLSEERREGTLGLLFLTDLNGFDVVLGKLVSRSLGAVYNLTATIPIFALSVLFGGITGQQIFSISLVLVAATILSLSVGVFISSRGRTERGVILGCMLAAAGVVLLPLCLWKLLVLVSNSGLGSALAKAPIDPLLWLSPVYAYNQAQRGAVEEVLLSCGTEITLSFGLIAYACWHIQRTWSHENAFFVAPTASPTSDFSPMRRVLRRALLHRNPMLWLVSHGQSQRWQVLAFAGFATVFGIFCRITLAQSWRWLVPVVVFGCYGLHAAYKFFVAGDACRILNEARRSGALELLLSTPLPTEFIMGAQIQATRKTWVVAGIALAVMNLIWMLEHDFFRELTIVAIGSWLLLIPDSYALVWRGMVNALRGERYSKTVFRTFFQVVGPPLAVIVLIFFATMNGLRDVTANFIYAFWTAGSVIYDVLLIRSAKRKLIYFRALASGEDPSRNRSAAGQGNAARFRLDSAPVSAAISSGS